MMFHDAVEVSGARITRDGYLVADARIARTGIQDYLGTEVGKPDMARVRVYRPAAEVFSADAMGSIAHRPITLDHPPANVTAENWKALAVGDVGGEITRDGECIRVPLKIMDADAISSIRSNRGQFSLGYSCTLDWTAGEFDGQAYDAIQRDIRVNHLAAVSDARGGSALRIIDERTSGDRTVPTKTITFDGLPLEVTDAAEMLINKLQGQLATSATALDAANTKVGELTASVATKDGEAAALKQQLADATDPVKVAARDAARAKVIADAKAIAPTLATDGKSDAEIKRAVVATKLGDAATTALDDAGINGAFAAFTVAGGTKVGDALRETIAGGVVSIGDAQTARDAALKARNDRFATAHSGAAAA